MPLFKSAARCTETVLSLSSFASGAVPVTVAERMRSKAESELSSRLQHACRIDKHIAEEKSAVAAGDGTGILLVAHTSTGFRHHPLLLSLPQFNQH